jgi:hypothetical protein
MAISEAATLERRSAARRERPAALTYKNDAGPGLEKKVKARRAGLTSRGGVGLSGALAMSRAPYAFSPSSCDLVHISLARDRILLPNRPWFAIEGGTS